MAPGDIHDLGGLSKDEIERRDERLELRLSALERAVNANGRPSLEDRMRETITLGIEKLRGYVDERDSHKQANAMQAITQVNTLVDYRINTLEKTSEERHKENVAKLDNQTKDINAINVKLGIAVGVAACAQIAIQHFWK